MWVHDYLVSAFSYDTTETYFDAFSFFRERKGVCQAYSLAYIAILREIGIDAVMVLSEEMNHAWNLVKIDDEWYHVDLVSDDPAPDRMGRVLHDYFLLDDRMIADAPEPHRGWKSSIPCSSSKYTEALWRGISSPFVWCNGQWYYIDPASQTLVVSDLNGDYRSDIYSFDEKWYVAGSESRYWVGVFSGVSEIFGHILVNTPQEVILYSPQNSRTSVFHESATDERIFGSLVYKNTLEYVLADMPPDIAEESRTETFAITDFDPSSFSKPLPFDDVSRLDSYYAAVRYVYSQGLFQGVSSTKFAPSAPLTRAMFVTVLGRLCRVNTKDFPDSEFSDIAPGQWYSPYVDWAADMGLVNGVGENCFDPFGEITHEQMIKIVAGLGRLLNLGSDTTSDALILFEDRAEISLWAVDSVAYCIANGLIDNMGMLLPTEAASRAEAAEIVARFAKLYGAA